MTQLALIPEAKAPAIEFSVVGPCICQGSKIALISGQRVNKGRDVWVKNPMASMVDQSDRKTKTQPANRLKSWKAGIEIKAAAAFTGELWQGPVMLECEFVMPRSPSHFTSKGALTKSAPMVPQKDLDKLLRAVGDALSKVVYRDDVQIISFGGSTKRFAKTREAIGGVFVKVSQV